MKVLGIDVTFFLIVLFLLLAILISLYFKDILNPILVLILPLSLQYGLYYFYLYEYLHLSKETNSILLLSIFSFFIGFLFFVGLPMIKSRFNKEQFFERSKRDFKNSKKLLLRLGILGFIIGLFTAFKYGVSGPGGFFFNLRYSNTITNENTGGISVYLLLLLHFITLTMIVFRKEWKVKTKTLLFLILLLLVSAAFTMARTNVLITLSSTLGVYMLSNRYLYKKKTKISALVFTVVGFGILSYLFAVGTQKISVDGNIFFNYIAYPILTFDNWVLNYPYQTDGMITFAFLYKILNAIGLVEYSPINIGNYVGVPRGEFNVFTFMSAPYLDFGLNGIIFVFLGLGMMFGFVYKRVRYGRPYWIVLYSILLYPLIMSFFEFQFNLSSYYYYVIVILFVFIRGNLAKENKISFLKIKRITW